MKTTPIRKKEDIELIKNYFLGKKNIVIIAYLS